MTTHTHTDYVTSGQGLLPPVVVFDSDKNTSPAKELIPNLGDCYDINQDDHAAVLHSVSLNGLLWKRKCLYQASLTSVPFIASVVECHACLLICLARNSSPMLQAFSVVKSLFSILMQSRSQVKGVGNWGILNLQILRFVIIIMIICMRQ